MKIILSVTFILLITFSALAQGSVTLIAKASVQNGDTLIMMNLPVVFIYSDYKYGRHHDKLVRNVRKAYPYAKLAGTIFEEYSILLENITDEKEKRRIMKLAEDELKEKYQGELEQLTVSQGKILIKLIDRETTHSTYELVKEFRGRFRAFFWQSFARIFGFDLKTEYDPIGEDKEIEEIVLLIEQGML
jgi:hypothetical protein